MGKKKDKKQQAAKREKRFLYTSIIAFAVGVVLLTGVFLHFDLFTYKSVFFEYSEQEIEVNQKIKENTYVAEIDAYGDVLIPKAQISTETVSFFEIEGYGERILAYAGENLNYRLGYDSCKKCMAEGRTGWFYENGGYLYCSVCGRGIELAELGSKNPSSDVHPVPVTDEMVEQRRTVLAVSKEAIAKLFSE